MLPLLIAAVLDLRSRSIPDWIPASLLAWAFLQLALGAGPGWGAAGLGLALGAAFGAGSFALGALGGGDAKLLTALGACLGPFDLGTTLLYMALAGGVLAAVAKLRGQRELAYGPAIAAGFALFLLLPEGPFLARPA